MKYVLKFWYWHQEIVIDDIKPEELIWSAFFPEDTSEEHEAFIRDIRIKGYDGNTTYPIQVVFSNDISRLLVYHLIENDEDGRLDRRFGDNGVSELDEDFWILDYVEDGK